jgi:hypothetical protein
MDRQWTGIVEILDADSRLVDRAAAQLRSTVDRIPAGDEYVEGHRSWSGTLVPLPGTHPKSWPSGEVTIRLPESGQESRAIIEVDSIFGADGTPVPQIAHVTGNSPSPF